MTAPVTQVAQNGSYRITFLRNLSVSQVTTWVQGVNSEEEA